MKEAPLTPLPEIVAMLNEAIFDLDEQTCAPKTLRMLLVSASRRVESVNHAADMSLLAANPVREAIVLLIRSLAIEMPESVRKQVVEVQLRLFAHI